MTRPLAAASALVLLLAVAPAAPVPKEKAKTPNYYPTALGSRWVYKVGATEIATEVTAVESKSGARLATIATLVNGKAVATERISVTAKGVFRDRINKADLKPPACILKSPLKSGDKWEVDSSVQGQVTKMSFTTGGSEEVEVPAGKYKAHRVDADGTIAGAQTGVTYWFAPDVGVVKIRYTIAGNESVLELKSFTAGKKN
ncbi:MAG TPA: hypothetical protein VFG68_20745 [Fimbriiglobus sp.]|nr:hypothetical protein [Fimbriiglobus sp.]